MIFGMLLTVLPGDGICHEGVWVESAGDSEVCEGEEKCGQSKCRLHEATCHLPGNSGCQVTCTNKTQYVLGNTGCQVTCTNKTIDIYLGIQDDKVQHIGIKVCHPMSEIKNISCSV